MTTLRAGRGGSGGGAGPGDGPIDDDARVELERQALPEFLRRQRWYAGKARKLE